MIRTPTERIEALIEMAKDAPTDEAQVKKPLRVFREPWELDQLIDEWEDGLWIVP